MTAYRGSLVVLKIGDGATPTEHFTIIGGMQITRLNMAQQRIENTTRTSGPWRQLQANAGLRAVAIDGRGAFTNTAAEQRLRSAAFGNQTRNVQCLFGNGDAIAGAFLIANYETDANVQGEETFRIQLESAGEVVFTAAS